MINTVSFRIACVFFIFISSNGCDRKGEEIVGSWVTDIDDRAPLKWGFTLASDGSASSINSRTFQYRKWRLADRLLLLDGERLVNRRTVAFTDSFSMQLLNDSTLSMVSGAGQKSLWQKAMNVGQILEEYATIYCFASGSGQMRADLRYNISGSTVIGNLSYNTVDGENKNGRFDGVIRGDTLFARHVFLHLGFRQQKEVLMLRKGDVWVAGSGETVDRKGTIRFSDRTKLSFSSQDVFHPVECK